MVSNHNCLHNILQIPRTPAEPECKTTDIRLLNSRRREVELAIRGDGSVKEGRVEICINGLWSSVCDNGWDSLDAKVVCHTTQTQHVIARECMFPHGV